MKIERFEDIEGWQEARVLARMVYKVSDKGRFAKDFPLQRQIEDAAASVMANIIQANLPESNPSQETNQRLHPLPTEKPSPDHPPPPKKTP